MTPIRRIHHINFLFRDLEAAVDRYEAALGIGPFEYETLDVRGVRTARARIGESWLVLVSPTDPESVPGRYLDRHGEGFFLLSFGVDDLEQAIAELGQGGDPPAVGPRRRGLAGWRIADLDVGDTLGVPMQLAEDPDPRGG